MFSWYVKGEISQCVLLIFYIIDELLVSLVCVIYLVNKHSRNRYICCEYSFPTFLLLYSTFAYVVFVYIFFFANWLGYCLWGTERYGHELLFYFVATIIPGGCYLFQDFPITLPTREHWFCRNIDEGVVASNWCKSWEKSFLAWTYFLLQTGTIHIFQRPT